MTYLNRLCWTLIGTLALCLIPTVGVTWHMVSVAREVDSTLIQGVK